MKDAFIDQILNLKAYLCRCSRFPSEYSLRVFISYPFFHCWQKRGDRRASPTGTVQESRVRTYCLTCLSTFPTNHRAELVVEVPPAVRSGPWIDPQPAKKTGSQNLQRWRWYRDWPIRCWAFKDMNQWNGCISSWPRYCLHLTHHTYYMDGCDSACFYFNNNHLRSQKSQLPGVDLL